METKVLKKCLALFIDIGEKVAELLEKEKFNWKNLVLFVVFKGAKIVYFVNHVQEGIQEWKDLDSVEKKEMKIWFMEEFDIPDDNLEVVIEQYFGKVIDMVTDENIQAVVNFFKQLKAK